MMSHADADMSSSDGHDRRRAGDEDGESSSYHTAQHSTSAHPDAVAKEERQQSRMSVSDLLSGPTSSSADRVSASRSAASNSERPANGAAPTASSVNPEHAKWAESEYSTSSSSSASSQVAGQGMAPAVDAVPGSERASFPSREYTSQQPQQRPQSIYQSAQVSPSNSAGAPAVAATASEAPSNEGVTAYQYAAVQQATENRDYIEYILTVREQPKHSRMCGVGEKADRRPIDPAPIIQLRVVTHDHPHPNKLQDPAQKQASPSSSPAPLRDARSAVTNAMPAGPSQTVTDLQGKKSIIRRGVPVQTEWGEGWEDKTWYLENPYYFMYAMLADAETDEELHLLGDGKTRYTTGSCVSCLYHLKDIDGSEQGFFVFPDLSIRVEGRYRLKLCLFETIGHEVHHCKSIYSKPFNVYTAKRFPGMEESTPLSKSFADQGLKVRVRKNPRARRTRAMMAGGKRKGDSAGSDDDSDGGGGGIAGLEPMTGVMPTTEMSSVYGYGMGGQQQRVPSGMSGTAPFNGSKRIRGEGYAPVPYAPSAAGSNQRRMDDYRRHGAPPPPPLQRGHMNMPMQHGAPHDDQPYPGYEYAGGPNRGDHGPPLRGVYEGQPYAREHPQSRHQGSGGAAFQSSHRPPPPPSNIPVQHHLQRSPPQHPSFHEHGGNPRMMQHPSQQQIRASASETGLSRMGGDRPPHAHMGGSGGAHADMSAAGNSFAEADPRQRPHMVSRRSEPHRPGMNGYNEDARGGAGDVAMREREMHYGGEGDRERMGRSTTAARVDPRGAPYAQGGPMSRPSPAPPSYGPGAGSADRPAYGHDGSMAAVARDRSTSDPYRTGQHHQYGHGGPMYASESPPTMRSDGQARRLPPLHVALSPETSSRSARPLASASPGMANEGAPYPGTSPSRSQPSSAVGQGGGNNATGKGAGMPAYYPYDGSRGPPQQGRPPPLPPSGSGYGNEEHARMQQGLRSVSRPAGRPPNTYQQSPHQQPPMSMNNGSDRMPPPAMQQHGQQPNSGRPSLPAPMSASPSPHMSSQQQQQPHPQQQQQGGYRGPHAGYRN